MKTENATNQEILANYKKKSEAAKEAGLPSPEFTEEESDALDAEFAESVLRDMRQKEAEWKQAGYCFSWIDPEPTYMGAGNWSLLITNNKEEDYCFEMPKPQVACRRIMRLSLLGGGQIRIMEYFKATPVSWGREFHGPTYHDKTELKVTAHTPEGVTIAHGEKYDGPAYEMEAQAVVLRCRHQSIADRVASTLRLIDTQADNFFALLDGAEGCSICGRALRDEISKLIAVGPCCAKECRIPHSREAAERRLTLRRKLLGES